jgi:hypothetical protein
MTGRKDPHATDAAPSETRDDPVARAILDLLKTLPPGRSIAPTQAARAVAAARAKPKDPPDMWRRYLPAVRQQALHLARHGRIAILRKGHPVDPNAPFKGVVRLALPEDPAQKP